jgi:hypothetical protein
MDEGEFKHGTGPRAAGATPSTCLRRGHQCKTPRQGQASVCAFNTCGRVRLQGHAIHQMPLPHLLPVPERFHRTRCVYKFFMYGPTGWIFEIEDGTVVVYRYVCELLFFSYSDEHVYWQRSGNTNGCNR